MERERFWQVLDILKRKTNEEDKISINDIANYLYLEYAVNKVTKNTLKKDIEAYINLGYDIHVTAGRSNEFYYQLVEREFTYDEVRLLIDAITINKFITGKQKKDLFSKFAMILPEREVRMLKSQIKYDHCIHENIDMIRNIRLIHLAINDNKLIRYKYGNYNEKKEFCYKDKEYCVIPKVIYYKRERYYLIGLDVLRDNEKRHYRVDRIGKLRIGEEHTHQEEIDMKDYEIKNFDMFMPESVERVVLRVDRGLIDLMIEQFGIDVQMRKDEGDSSKIIVSHVMGIGEGLIRWLLNQGRKIEVLSPISLREKIKEELDIVRVFYD